MKLIQGTAASNRASRTLVGFACLTVALISVAAGLMDPAATPQQLARASTALEQERTAGRPITQGLTFSASWAEYWTAVGNAAGTF